MKRSQTKFKFIHCKTLHCNFSQRVIILDYLLLQTPSPVGTRRWRRLRRTSRPRGPGWPPCSRCGGRGPGPASDKITLCNVKWRQSCFVVCVENPSSAAWQVLTSSACGQSFEMSFAGEASILPRVMGNHNGLLVLRKYQQMLNLHFTIICHTGN